MVYTLPPIACATTPDGTVVARFGHGFPVVTVAADGSRGQRQAEGCCGGLAQAVGDCAVVICTAIGRGAAAHLAEAGVPLAIVPEGTSVAAALASWRSGALTPGGEPSACDHGHGAAVGCGGGHH